MFSFLVTEDGGLTGAGYVVFILAGILFLIGAAVLARKSGEKSRRTMAAKELVYCAAAIALAFLTSYIRVMKMPWGGSVTLCSMLFICLPGYFYGLGAGLLSATAYGVLQFLLGPYILFPIQIIVDYLLAFGAFGLSGLFAKSRRGLLKGYLIGILGRYVFSVLSGWLFFGEYAWAGWGALSYSLVYNAAYIFAEGILTIVILLIPSVSKALARVKEMAIN